MLAVFVVADYAGSVTAKIGNNTSIDNTTGVTVDATIQSGMASALICLMMIQALKVFTLSWWGRLLGVGLAASIAQVNPEENARAEIGDNVTINTASNTADITVSSDRDIDAEVLVAAVAGGIAAAGISVVDINTSGDSLAVVGANTNFGTSDNKTGDVLVTVQ